MTQEEKTGIPAEVDEFEALLAAEDESEEEEAVAGAQSEESEEEAEAEAQPPEGSQEAQPSGEEESEEDDGEGEDEKPEPQRLEESEERFNEVEKENRALRRKLYALREERRLRDERDRLREQDTGDDEPPVIGKLNEDGSLVLDRDALRREMSAVAPSAARGRPAQGEVADVYKQFKSEILEEVDPAGRDAAREAIEEVEGAYRWIDDQVGQFCEEAKLDPREIDGYSGLIRLAEESGLAEEFEAKYPDLSISDLIIAPTNTGLLRRQLKRHIQRRSSPRKPKEKGEESVETPPAVERPRGMQSKGKHRAPASRTKLTDVDAEDIFDMSDEDYAEFERNSLEALER